MGKCCQCCVGTMEMCAACGGLHPSKAPSCAAWVGSCPASPEVPDVLMAALLVNQPPGSRVCLQPLFEKSKQENWLIKPHLVKMNIFNWCLGLEERMVKTKLNFPAQMCLCVREKWQLFPLVFVGPDLWEHETLGAIVIVFGSWRKENRFDCSLQIKI